MTRAPARVESDVWGPTTITTTITATTTITVITTTTITAAPAIRMG